MARPKRFELLTPRFVVWCSIQLSYGRVFRELTGCLKAISLNDIKAEAVAKEFDEASSKRAIANG